jgi:hypothetical protein
MDMEDDMRVVVFMRAVAESEAGVPPTAEAFAAKRIVFDGADSAVSDGPFAVAELVAGFSSWEVKDMDEAVAWARQCPPGGGRPKRDRDPAVPGSAGFRGTSESRGVGKPPRGRAGPAGAGLTRSAG